MNAHNSSIHLRLLHSPAKLVILPPSHRREIDAYLVAAKVEAKGQVVAVTGASVTKETVQSAWKRSTAFFNDKEDAHLYWLDEGGHIIESSRPPARHVDRFHIGRSSTDESPAGRSGSVLPKSHRIPTQCQLHRDCQESSVGQLVRRR